MLVVVTGTAGTKPHTDADWNVESGLSLEAVGTQDPHASGAKLSDIWGSGNVMDDHTTAENEVLDYNPAAYEIWDTTEKLTAAYPWLTEQIGTGPYVFYNINDAAGIGNLVVFDTSVHATVHADDHYALTVGEMHNALVEDFWELGDVDINGQVRVVYDLAIQGANYFGLVPPAGDAPWRADINSDGIIDIRDMSFGGLNFGEDREVLP